MTDSESARCGSRRALFVFGAWLCFEACSPPPKAGITVAAAANLTEVCRELAGTFEARTGIPVTYSFGSTGNLARQIEHDAPFDVFLAADTQHIDQLESQGLLTSGSKAVYARGRLALWIPPSHRSPASGLPDLAGAPFRFIAIAQPGTAPYGLAAVQALKAAGIFPQVEPKLVYAESISMAKQYASSGNADACLTAYSLVRKEPGQVMLIDEGLYRPINQALGIVKRSGRQDLARRFAEFLLSAEARRILAADGYAITGL